MLKLWGPSGDQTPKAERKNPFDSLSSAPTPSSGASAIARAHIPPSIQAPSPSFEAGSKTTLQASGARTPTTPSAHHHHHLLHLPQHHEPAAPSPTTTTTTTLPTVPSQTALPTTFVSRDPPEFATMMKPPPLSRNATLTAVPTLSSSSPAPPAVSNLNALSDQVTAAGTTTTNSGTSPQSNSSPTQGPSSSPTPGQSRGQLHVKLIQARALNVKSIQSRPYVVVQFENNEFVSRDPISDKEKEVKGTAQPLSRNNSSSALTSLAASGISRAFEAAVNRGLSRAAGSATPTSEKPAGGLLFGSTMSPHNPTWKHEVTLYVLGVGGVDDDD